MPGPAARHLAARRALRAAPEQRSGGNRGDDFDDFERNRRHFPRDSYLEGAKGVPRNAINLRFQSIEDFQSIEIQSIEFYIQHLCMPSPPIQSFPIKSS